MATSKHIIEKALRCIDESITSIDPSGAPLLPLDSFLDEACRRVIAMSPVNALGDGVDMSSAKVTPNEDGSGVVCLPIDFVRLISFKMQGWQRPVFNAINESSPLYLRQYNAITRGGHVKPVVVIKRGNRRLEYFSLPKDAEHIIEEARYFGFSSADSNYPARLIDPTAWQLASLVLQVTNEINAAQIAQQRATELISIL